MYIFSVAMSSRPHSLLCASIRQPKPPNPTHGGHCRAPMSRLRKVSKHLIGLTRAWMSDIDFGFGVWTISNARIVI